MKPSVRVALLVACFALPAHANPPRGGDERVVLHTIAGDIVLQLYPDAAPRHVAQLLALFRAHAYDGTHFVRIEPGFIVQISTAEDRVPPLGSAQRALITRLPLEVTPAVKHERGVLTMARPDADRNGAETSFSIVLGPAPHLDGGYTVFGRVESGFDVVDVLARVPCRGNRPRVRLDIVSAEVLPAAELSRRLLAPARAIAVPPEVQIDPSLAGTVVAGLVLVAVLALLVALAGPRLAPGRVRALALGQVLVAGFVLFTLLVPIGRDNGWIAATLFVAALGMFKLMGRFE